MQRSASSSRASEKNYIVDMLQKSGAKLLSINGGSSSYHDLPLYHNRHGVISRRESSRSSEKWVHIIPVIVIFCILSLWWFSYPVDLEISDGRITSVRQVEVPRSLNETRIDLTFLASAIPPYAASIYLMQTLENETAAPPVAKVD